MIYDLPHITSFGDSWARLRIQWETVHICPQRKDGNTGFVYLDLDWLNYIKAMNTPEAFQWMTGDSGTIIWGIRNKKNLAAKENKARMPLIAIGGNKIRVWDVKKGWGAVQGMGRIDYSVTPGIYPELWHRIWCVTKLRKGQVSPPHDTPRGPAYLPIVDVRAFKRSKSLSAGRLFCHYA